MRAVVKTLLLLSCIILAPVASHAGETVVAVQGKQGVKAWLAEEQNLPIVVIELTFRNSGSAYDPADKRGLSTMVASLLMEGAGKLDGIAFKKSLEERAIVFNISTDEDYISIRVKTLKDHLEKALTLLQSMLTEPRFEEEAVARIRSQLETAIAKNKENPTYIADLRLKRLLFQDHPYGYPVMGTEETIQNITQEDLRSFADRYFTRSNLVISVVGAMNKSELTEALDNYFAALPAASKTPIAVLPKLPAPPAKGKMVTIQKALPQSIALFGGEGVTRQEHDFYAAFVLNYILGGGNFESRLMQEVREKKGLAYSVYTNLDMLHNAGTIRGYVATKNEKIQASLAIVKAEYHRLREEGITEKELQQAKQYLVGSFPLNLDKNEKMAYFLNVMQLEDLGRDYLEQRNSYLQAVTLDDVNRVARRLLDPSKLMTVVVGGSAEEMKEEEKEHKAGKGRY